MNKLKIFLSIFLLLSYISCTPNPPLGKGFSEVIVTNTWEGFDTNEDGIVDIPIEQACPHIMLEDFLFSGRWELSSDLEEFAELPWNITFEINRNGVIDVWQGDQNRSYGTYWYCNGPQTLSIDASSFSAGLLGQRLPVRINPGEVITNDLGQVIEVLLGVSNQKNESATGSLFLTTL